MRDYSATSPPRVSTLLKRDNLPCDAIKEVIKTQFQARLLKRGLIVLRPSTSPSEFFQLAICCTERSTSAISCDSLPRHASSFKFFKLLKQILLVQVVILGCDSLIVATSLWTFRDVCSVLLHMHSQASCNDKFRSSLLLQSSSFYEASPTLTYFVKRHIKFLTDKPTRQVVSDMNFCTEL